MANTPIRTLGRVPEDLWGIIKYKAENSGMSKTQYLIIAALFFDTAVLTDSESDSVQRVLDRLKQKEKDD